MNCEFPKRIRAALRPLAAVAHERELRRLLVGLDGDFDRWRRGEIDSFALIAAVDRLARGRGRRDLEGRYGTNSLLTFMVARAIVAGILKPEEVPADVVEALGHELDVIRRGLADGSICLELEEG